MQTETMTAEQELAFLRAENAKLKSAAPKDRALSLKVSTKGAISLYGMGRFPVTLYAEQWIKVFGVQKEVVDFIATNHAILAKKQ